MSSPIKNVLIAGATGSLGAPILAALLAEPSFNVTILTRASSSAKFPANVPVRSVSDAFTTEELTEAFKGQDAVVSALTTGAVTKDTLAYRLVDAVIAAGVKRYIPSEFGTNNLDPRARSMVPVYDAKGAALEYLQKKAKESQGRLTWTSFACGSWLDWALDPSKSGNFLGFNVKERKVTVWDSGKSRFAITTSSNTGLAVVRSLLPAHYKATANQQVYLADFMTDTLSILDALEKATGEKWSVDKKSSNDELAGLRAKYDGGDFNAAFALLAVSFVADVNVGYEFDKEQKVWNDELGLPGSTLEGIAKEAVELANRT
jgi:putative NADH-flavin reductase